MGVSTPSRRNSQLTILLKLGKSSRTVVEIDHLTAAEKVLQTAKSKNHRMRRRVSGLLLVIGTVLGLLGCTLVAFRQLLGPPRLKLSNSTADWCAEVPSWGQCWRDAPPLAVFTIPLPMSCYVLSMAVLPTDARLIRLLCAQGFVGSVAGMVFWAFLATLDPFFAITSLLCLATAIAFVPTLRWRRRSGCRIEEFEMTPRRALARCWLILRTVVSFTAVAVFTTALISLAVGDDGPISHVFRSTRAQEIADMLVAPFWLLLTAMVSPANRRRVHAWLIRLRGLGEHTGAASVAALIGRFGDTAVALQRAKSSFRALPLARLEEADLGAAGANLASSDLASRTTSCELGGCDAFLSHSWRDSGAAKFAVLQRWRRQFVEKNGGREPTIWLDKACLDQNNIDASLACLPVFLAGCSRLLVVAGETYCSRLWCVMEIFVFLAIGRRFDDIDVVPIGKAVAVAAGNTGGSGGFAAASQADEAAAELRKVRLAFTSFDAAQAQCFKVEDRDHLLGVIEHGFGSFDAFNAVARKMLAERDSLREREMSDGVTPAPLAATTSGAELNTVAVQPMI